MNSYTYHREKALWDAQSKLLSLRNSLNSSGSSITNSYRRKQVLWDAQSKLLSLRNSANSFALLGQGVQTVLNSSSPGLTSLMGQMTTWSRFIAQRPHVYPIKGVLACYDNFVAYFCQV
jgi:hypothetical protein